jgi:polysaccharide biosynthesis transport protein
MNNLIKAPATSPTAAKSFADLELVPLQRQVSHRTGLEEILAAVHRQRLVILTAIAITLIVAGVLTLTAKPSYTAVASVQVDQWAPRVFADDNLEPRADEKDAERFLQTQVDRARSRTIAETVANKLQLAKSPISLEALEVEADDQQTAQRDIIQELQQRVQVAIGLNTRVAQISFTSGHPVVSARVANAFAASLIEANLEQKNQTSARAKQVLLKQLADAKQRLEGSERRMLAYARSADLTTTIVAPTGNDASPGSLRAQQLGLMTGSLAEATARRIDAQQQWAQVQGTDPLSLPEVQTNSAIQDLVSQKAQLQAALQEERQRHTDEYPSVRETAAKIAELNGQIGGFAARIKASFRGRYSAAAQQERQMASTVAGMRASAMSERERGVGFNSLGREVETNKAFYDGLLQRYKEVAAAAGAAAANISIVDPAWPPPSADSSLGRDLAFAGISGLLLALLVGGVRERMHNVIRSTDDLEHGVNLPALGVVPRLSGANQIPMALEDPSSPCSEAYHSIAVALEQATGGGLPKTLLITSSTASEGKSTSAWGIAKSLSARGKRVIVVDADLRRFATELRSEEEASGPGLSNVLEGSTAAHEAVQRYDGATFSVICAGDIRTSPVALLAPDHMKDILDQLLESHDIVIVDGPPIMGLADAVLLARSVEAVLVVVEANRTLSSQVDVAISRLPQSNVIGGVITKFDPKSAGVQYGGYDYYSYSGAN